MRVLARDRDRDTGMPALREDAAVPAGSVQPASRLLGPPEVWGCCGRTPTDGCDRSVFVPGPDQPARTRRLGVPAEVDLKAHYWPVGAAPGPSGAFSAVRWGEETWRAPGRPVAAPTEACPDCWTPPMEFHHVSCQLAQCPMCGGRLASCGCVASWQ